jgi:predicted small integral membrane protein
MLITRLAKIVMCLALGLFCLFVAFDKFTDYATNYLFVQHVLSMDTTLPGNSLKYRAITSPVLWQQAYAAIIAAESLARLLFVVGAVVLCAYGLRPLLPLIMRRAMRLQAPRLHSLASWSSVASGSPCGNRQLGTARRPPSASTWRRSRS